MARTDGPVTVCVINLKGGVGKSTIAALLARRGYRTHDLDVLAIDLDPQANLSQGLMHSDYSKFLTQQRPSIVELFSGYIPPTPKASTPKPLLPNPEFEIIAESGPRSLQLIPSRFDFSDNLLGAVRPDPKTLARYLSSNFQHKDLIIIDCSPTESVFTTAGSSPRDSWAWSPGSRSRSSHSSAWNSSAVPRQRRPTRAAPSPARSTPSRCAWRSLVLGQ